MGQGSAFCKQALYGSECNGKGVTKQSSAQAADKKGLDKPDKKRSWQCLGLSLEQNIVSQV